MAAQFVALYASAWACRRAWAGLAGSETRAPVRRVAELLRFALPNAAFCRMESMGHMGPITHSNPVAERIAQFIQEQAFVPRNVERELAA